MPRMHNGRAARTAGHRSHPPCRALGWRLAGSASMGGVGIELGRPAAGDYEVWAARAIAGYAAEIAASGALGEEAAWDKARRDHERALPNGLDTPGQLIFRLLDGSQP